MARLSQRLAVTACLLLALCASGAMARRKVMKQYYPWCKNYDFRYSELLVLRVKGGLGPALRRARAARRRRARGRPGGQQLGRRGRRALGSRRPA
jgi:hypothetical protein